MDKYLPIMVVAVLVLMFSSILIGENIKAEKSKTMAKAGLEECLGIPDMITSNTIWVRSCDEYMKSWKSSQEMIKD